MLFITILSASSDGVFKCVSYPTTIHAFRPKAVSPCKQYCWPSINKWCRRGHLNHGAYKMWDLAFIWPPGHSNQNMKTQVIWSRYHEIPQAMPLLVTSVDALLVKILFTWSRNIQFCAVKRSNETFQTRYCFTYSRWVQIFFDCWADLPSISQEGPYTQP